MADSEETRIRVLTDADVDAVVDHLVNRLSDRRTVEQITLAWSGVVDRAIGRGIRRLVLSLAFALVLVGAYKFGLFEKITQ